MTRRFTVTWIIDVFEDSPEAAAAKALAIQRDPESIATVFSVVEYGESDQKTVVVDVQPQEGDDD